MALFIFFKFVDFEKNLSNLKKICRCRKIFINFYELDYYIESNTGKAST